MYMPWQQLTLVHTHTGTHTLAHTLAAHWLHMFHLRVCLCNLQLHKTANKVANITIQSTDKRGGEGEERGLGRSNNNKNKKRTTRRQNAKKSTFAAKGFKSATHSKYQRRSAWRGPQAGQQRSVGGMQEGGSEREEGEEHYDNNMSQLKLNLKCSTSSCQGSYSYSHSYSYIHTIVARKRCSCCQLNYPSSPSPSLHSWHRANPLSDCKVIESTHKTERLVRRFFSYWFCSGNSDGSREGSVFQLPPSLASLASQLQ